MFTHRALLVLGVALVPACSSDTAPPIQDLNHAVDVPADRTVPPHADRGSGEPVPADSSGLLDIPSSVAADLTIKDIHFEPLTVPPGGHLKSISYTYCNYGPQPLASPNTKIKTTFHLSKNEVMGDSDDLAFGPIVMDTELASGKCQSPTWYEGALTYMPVPTAASGAYYVFLRVDHESPSQLQDPRPSNNAAHSSGTLQVK